MGKRCVKSKHFQESKVSTNLFPIKDTIRLQKLYPKIVQSTVVQAQKGLQIEKSAGIKVAGNLVTNMESVSRFELALIEKKLLARWIFKNMC